MGLFRKPYHKGDSAQKSDRIFGSEMAGCGQRKREKMHYKPLDLYAEKLDSYLNLINLIEQKRNERSLTYSVVKFEDFVTDQKATYMNISPLLRGLDTEFKS